jgi:hypothetical protein
VDLGVDGCMCLLLDDCNGDGVFEGICDCPGGR